METMHKHKLLIVGSFPLMRGDYAENTFYGGINTSCEVIMDSVLAERYEIVPLDSSQNSMKPPGTFLRTIFAIKRILVLVSLLLFRQPSAALIFASDGGSALEKGLMIWICNIFNCGTLIFPRAGNLIRQTSQSKIMLKLIKSLFGRASIFLCQGPQWRDYAIDTLGISESRVHVVNNWTATKSKLEIGASRNYESNESIANILFVGWLEDFKGVFDLLTACLALRDAKFEFKLTLAGHGSAYADAYQFVLNNNLDAHVSFVGWVDSVVLDELLGKTNIFVLPSWSEGLPNAMIESMAAGLAAIVTSVGVIPDFIENDQNGIIIPQKSPKKLEAALQRLITDKPLRNRLALNGHNMVRKEFSSELSIAELSKVIEELTS